MKKIIAVLLIVSILSANNAPIAAQALRGASAAGKASRAIKVFAAPRVNGAVFARGFIPKLENTVATAARISIFGKTPTASLIRQRVSLGKMDFVPEVILTHPNDLERASLLRREFGVAAADGYATVDQISLATTFWKKDILEKSNLFSRLQNLAQLNAQDKEYVIDLINDASNISMLGDVDSISALSYLQSVFVDSALEETFATAYARALLRLGLYTKLEQFFLINIPGKFPKLQNGVREYAIANDLSVNIAPLDKVAVADEKVLTTLVAKQGELARLTIDSSAEATSIWMAKSKGAIAQADLATIEPVEVDLPKVQTPINITVAEEGSLLAASTEIPTQVTSEIETATSVVAQSAQGTVATESTAVVPAKTSSLLGIGKKFTDATKAMFKSKKVPAAPETEGEIVEDSFRAKFQRGSIYAAAFAMGLEVGTPVITNIGTDFGLSLEDNILVAAATYFPYSVGAFFANWVKQKIGRQGSLNLGLSMMLGSFLTGVFLCGLDGSFVAGANIMKHFYEVLACITGASFGGVLVHNSVGPLMTELSAKASELVRQQRSTATEFSRALGMASTYAFPWLATEVLQKDWSLAFAMPIPLVALALAGSKFAKLPNTKPTTEKAITVDPKVGKSFLDKVKSNEYVRLFKEEKGTAALLGGLAIMNAVETSISNGFLFLLPDMVKDPSSIYIAGLMQFAAPFLLGRYLASKFLKWFPQNNLSAATTLAAAGSAVSLLPGIYDSVVPLTTALFVAETGISTAFTLAFARTARNPATQDRITSLIVASALACAVGPVALTNIAQALMDSGIMSSANATYAMMIGVPTALTLLSAKLFKKAEGIDGKPSESILKKIGGYIKRSLFHPKERRQRS